MDVSLPLNHNEPNNLVAYKMFFNIAHEVRLVFLISDKEVIMTAKELIKHMMQLKKYRASMYLSREKMEQWYLQKVSPILELGTGEVLSGKIEAGFPGLYKSEGAGQRSSESKVAIDNEIVQGVVAENVARASKTLLLLSSDTPKKGELCYYLGAARTTRIKETVTPDNTGLTPDECRIIQKARSAQEESLKVFYPEARTMLLTFKTNDQAFASICSTKTVNPNWPTSYWSEENFGILCTLERVNKSVIFLDPIWIWHE